VHKQERLFFFGSNIFSGEKPMKQDAFDLEISIEELEQKIAPDDNGETVLPLAKPGRRRINEEW
jgi:hypothetical protein